MSDRERNKLYSVICIPSEQNEISGMYDEIFKHLSTSLVNKILDVIQDGKEYIASMGKVAQEEADGIVQYMMCLDMKPLTRCKDCTEWQDDWGDGEDGCHFCGMNDRWTEADFYCADGEVATVKDKDIKDSGDVKDG